jgi:hypothetical protein
MRKTDRRPRPANALLKREPSRLARLVPRLKPAALERIIQNLGLEACGDLLAHATSEQLQQVLDLDVWRPAGPGQDEELDADRVVEWLDTLADSGAEVALRTLAKMDATLVIDAIAQHVRVFDLATVECAEAPVGCEVGGYLVQARRHDTWETVVGFLKMLEADGPEHFHRLMRGCRKLSNSRPEIDGLHDVLTDDGQAMFDLAIEREERRETQGYATPAQARVFLQSAREVPLRALNAPASSPVSEAYFRAIGLPRPARAGAPTEARDSRSLPARQGPAGHYARLQTYMQLVESSDHGVYLTRTAEIAFLANTVAAGCAVQSRPLTPQEASEAAGAVCNLGLENWPSHWQDGFDLITAFQVGWTILYKDVCLHAAECLLLVIAELRPRDHEVRAGLHTLRFELARHWRAGAPWRAREAMDVLLLMDQPTWAALLALIDEFPVLHAGLGASIRSAPASVDPTAFKFIATNRQIGEVGDFLEGLRNRVS